MPSAADLVELTDRWVAEPIVENPRGSNCCRIPHEFGPIGPVSCYAWCAATVTLAIGAVFGHELYRSAAVSGWIEAARRGVSGMRLLPRDNTWIEPGMLVTYDYGPFHGKPAGNPANFHIAIVRDGGSQVRFQTNAGNESDRMQTAWRDRNRDVTHFIGLPFDDAAPPAPPQQGVIDMVPGTCRDKDGHLWQFYLDDGQKCSSVRDGKANNRPLGDVDPGWSSGFSATCDLNPGSKSYGAINVSGRALDGTLAQIAFFPGGPKATYDRLPGHIFPK